MNPAAGQAESSSGLRAVLDRIRAGILKVAPFIPDPQIQRMQASFSPAEIANNAEALERWFAEAIASALAAARAEALEEALAAARAAGEEACKGFVLTGPAGIVSRMLAAIRALSAPLPPREES